MDNFTAPESFSSPPTTSRLDAKKVGLAVLAITSIAFMAATGWLFLQSQEARAEATKLNQQIIDEQLASAPTLPPNAVKASGCVPGEGEHWVVPENLPNGPMYAAWNGKVMSMEYMFTPEEIPGLDTSKMTREQFAAHLQANKLSFADFLHNRTKKNNLFEYKFKDFAIFYSGPHAGLTQHHIDMHFYFVDDAYLRTICPNSTPADAGNPEIIKALAARGIPVPGATSSASPSATPSATPKR
jgi:hypothetical protein